MPFHPRGYDSQDAQNKKYQVGERVNLSELDNLSLLADWRRVPFLIIDSPQTRRSEDAVATREYRDGRDWTADLKVVHPLPLSTFVSLQEGEQQVCLGIRDKIDASGSRRPLVSMVMVERLTKVTDRQAKALLNGQGQSVGKLAGTRAGGPESDRTITSQLKLIRATALQVSPWVNRDLTPEHCISLLTTHAQTTAIRASRELNACPTLIVLRPEGTRHFTNVDAEKVGIPARVKGGSVALACGKMVPTPLRSGEDSTPHDTLRLKERSNSGAINMTQLACVLLGIEPIPDSLVQEGLRPDSEQDTWSRGGPIPEGLATALAKRRAEIREVLHALGAS